MITLMTSHQKRALVTGGAGLIGSHFVDLLLREGWQVRILDNLEPQTHKNGKPAWINPEAEFRQGNVQDHETMLSALTDIDVVFHEGAPGGYMPEMAKYVLVNSFATAQMLEIIRDRKLPHKVVVARSQAVYSEGAALCEIHGHVAPSLRPQSSYGRAISWSIVLSVGDPLRRFRRLKGLPAAERPSMRSPRSIRRDWYCCGGNRLAFSPWRCAIPVPMGPGSRCSIHIRE
jgi:NAD(P)-dependent dehydrogenase (short-subunit alcohol dehydrogenase family)